MAELSFLLIFAVAALVAGFAMGLRLNVSATRGRDGRLARQVELRLGRGRLGPDGAGWRLYCSFILARGRDGKAADATSAVLPK